MSMYRFCGAASEVGELALKKFGQRVDITDDLAKDAILGGACLVPAAEFDKIAFTEQELSIYGDPSSHAEANAAFLAKKKRVGVACHEIRLKLQAGGSLKEFPEPAHAPAKSAAPETPTAQKTEI